jgi:hypothetical protein
LEYILKCLPIKLLCRYSITALKEGERELDQKETEGSNRLTGRPEQTKILNLVADDDENYSVPLHAILLIY